MLWKRRLAANCPMITAVPFEYITVKSWWFLGMEELMRCYIYLCVVQLTVECTSHSLLLISMHNFLSDLTYSILLFYLQLIQGLL